jgi:hypothetical protein
VEENLAPPNNFNFFFFGCRVLHGLIPYLGVLANRRIATSSNTQFVTLTVKIFYVVTSDILMDIYCPNRMHIFNAHAGVLLPFRKKDGLKLEHELLVFLMDFNYPLLNFPENSHD